MSEHGQILIAKSPLARLSEDRLMGIFSGYESPLTAQEANIRQLAGVGFSGELFYTLPASSPEEPAAFLVPEAIGMYEAALLIDCVAPGIAAELAKNPEAAGRIHERVVAGLASVSAHLTGSRLLYVSDGYPPEKRQEYIEAMRAVEGPVTPPVVVGLNVGGDPDDRSVPEEILSLFPIPLWTYYQNILRAAGFDPHPTGYYRLDEGRASTERAWVDNLESVLAFG